MNIIAIRDDSSVDEVNDIPPPASSPSSPNPSRGYSVMPPDMPTQKGPAGILYDFNDGARLFLPPGQWHAQIIDVDTGNILFSCDSEGGWISSTKKYFVNFGFKVWKRGEKEPILDHRMDLKGKPVVISFPVGTLGDLIGWFPYAERFM